MACSFRICAASTRLQRVDDGMEQNARSGQEFRPACRFSRCTIRVPSWKVSSRVHRRDACREGKSVRRINVMKTHIENRAGVAVGFLVLVAFLGVDRGFARAPGENQTGAVFLDRGGQPRLKGSLLSDLGSGLKFLPRAGEPQRPVALEAGSVLSFQGTEPLAVSIPPLYRVQVGESARISGMLHAVSDKAVTLGVPWQEAEVVVARPGVQAVLQRTGEARVFVDRFDRLIDSRWLCSGKPELLDQR